MNTCATCRFWYDENTDRPIAEDLAPRDANYEVVFPGYEAKRCQAMGEFTYPPRNGGSTIDGSGYYAALATGPDFGCVLWEPKA